MDRREELRREIDALLDELADEGDLGVARAPEPREVPRPVADDVQGHGHGHDHAGMVTFGMWADDGEGNLVEVDPGRLGRYDPEVDEVRPAEAPPHPEGHGEGHRDAPAPRRRASRGRAPKRDAT